MGVLITDGASRQALAIVRSLGRRGIRTYVGDPPRSSLASVSRYCSGVVPLAPPDGDPDRFRSSLRQAVEHDDIDVVMPVSDAAVSSLYPMRGELERHALVAAPSGEAFDRVTDKSRLYELAAELGLPYPRTVMPAGPDDLEPAGNELGWPVVVKPRRSKVRTDDLWLSALVGYARTGKELRRVWSDLHQVAPYPLLQERIVGPTLGVFFLARRGRTLALFAHRRLRDKPPSGGVSVLRESMLPEQPMVRTAQRLVEALSWTGIGMVELKRDSRTGRAMLIEVNARWWGSLQLAVDAEVDFPYLLYRCTVDDDFAPVVEGRPGVRTRWFLGDLDHLLSICLVPRSRLSLPPDHPGRLKTLAGFLTSFANTRTEVLRRDDPRPFLHELARYASGAPGKIGAVLSGKLPRPDSVCGG